LNIAFKTKRHLLTCKPFKQIDNSGINRHTKYINLGLIVGSVEHSNIRAADRFTIF